MSPETGRFTTMDSYAGALDNPVSLHKYLYANANPVMNTDPTGYFSLMDTTIAQGIQSTIDSVIVPYFNVKKIMSWANMAVTAYDVAQQIRMIYAGEASILGLTFALAKGFIVQALITCAATAALGEAAVWVLKAVNISMDSVSFVEAVKSGDPEKIIVESLRLSVSLFTLTCQCFTGETLVSTAEGETRIDEIKPGDMVWSYDTEKGERVLKKVTKVKESETDVIVHVKTSDGKDINTTMFHPFMTEKEGRREWKAASNLQKGDNLITENGESVYVEEVRVEKLAERVTVYNLEVEDLHVYYVAGVLVHNDCEIIKGTRPHKEINIDPKQLGKKWGKHMFDYDDISSYSQYKDKIFNVFNNPDEIIFDSYNEEYLYVKGTDLLRVKLDGEFISLYPGGSTSKVKKALSEGGVIWEKS